MLVIGQQKLIKIFDSFTLQTLPQTIMLLGEKGCGKHFFTSYLAERFNLAIKEITPETTSDQILDFSRSPLHVLYFIDLSEFIEAKQNQLLKFIEEPPQTANIILAATSEIGILPTILNRCIKYHFEPYSRDELNSFTWMITGQVDDLAFRICTTPGQLLSLKMDQLKAMQTLSLKLINHINSASYSQTTGIITKINIKEEYDKFDCLTFLRVLEDTAFTCYIRDNNELAWKIYKVTAKQKQAFVFNKSIGLNSFMLNFLTLLWRCTR